MNLLCLSTLLHFFSIFPIMPYYNTCAFYYINIILLSTCLSILYHLYKESNYIIMICDHLSAFCWFLYDAYFGYNYNINIILYNCASFGINIIIKYDDKYYINHSMWHIINSCKCIYVSNLIKYVYINNKLV